MKKIAVFTLSCKESVSKIDDIKSAVYYKLFFKLPCDLNRDDFLVGLKNGNISEKFEGHLKNVENYCLVTDDYETDNCEIDKEVNEAVNLHKKYCFNALKEKISNIDEDRVIIFMDDDLGNNFCEYENKLICILTKNKKIKQFYDKELFKKLKVKCIHYNDANFAKKIKKAKLHLSFEYIFLKRSDSSIYHYGYYGEDVRNTTFRVDSGFWYTINKKRLYFMTKEGILIKINRSALDAISKNILYVLIYINKNKPDLNEFIHFLAYLYYFYLQGSKISCNTMLNLKEKLSLEYVHGMNKN